MENQNVLLRLNDNDNIAVLKHGVAQGEQIKAFGHSFVMAQALEMGHKIAISDISCGSDVTKYGAKIGFAARDIKRGEHVHLHNLSSDYTTIEDMDK